jgi:hypothetical protein
MTAATEAPASGRAVLEKALEFACMTIAFIGRDQGTDRIDRTLSDLTGEAIKLERQLRPALASLQQPQPVEGEEWVRIHSAAAALPQPIRNAKLSHIPATPAADADVVPIERRTKAEWQAFTEEHETWALQSTAMDTLQALGLVTDLPPISPSDAGDAA